MGPEGEVSHGHAMSDQPILVFHNCLGIQYCTVGWILLQNALLAHWLTLFPVRLQKCTINVPLYLGDSLLAAKANILCKKVSSKNPKPSSAVIEAKKPTKSLSAEGEEQVYHPVHPFAMGWSPWHQDTSLGCSKKIWLDLFVHVSSCHQMQREIHLCSVKAQDRGTLMFAITPWVRLTCSAPASQSHISIKSFGRHGEVFTVNTVSCSVFSDPSLTHGTGSPQENFCACLYLTCWFTTEAHVRA